MQPNSDRVADLIDLVWAGIEEVPPWQSLVRALRREFSCSYVGFVLRHPAHPAGNDFATSDADWNTRRWMERYFPEYLDEYNPFSGKDLVPGEVYTIDQVVDLEQWMQSKVFRECLHPSGIDYSLCIRLGEADGYAGYLYCCRSDTVGPYNGMEQDICRALAPWLQRGLRLFSALMRKTIEHDIAEDTLRRMGIGAILIGPDHNVLSADMLARDILKCSSGISLRDRKLHIHSRDAAASFRTRCEKLLQQGSSGGIGAVRVPRPGHADLRLLIRLVNRDYGQADKRSLLIHISDPELDVPEPAGEVIAELFGLTKSEAMVVALLIQGLSPAEISEQLGLALLTVRTHIKHIFSKVGVSRQTELVSTVMGSLAILSASAST